MRLPRVSSRDAISALLALGFEIDRTRGSHTYLVKGEREVNIPKRDTIPVGLMKCVLRDADIQPQEFIDALP